MEQALIGIEMSKKNEKAAAAAAAAIAAAAADAYDSMSDPEIEIEDKADTDTLRLTAKGTAGVSFKFLTFFHKHVTWHILLLIVF